VTQPLDPVDQFLDAYFDYLEGVGEEPSLDHLNPEQRAEAEQLIASLDAARGINPEASRPSVADLLARANARQQAMSANVLGAALEAELQRHADPRARVVEDAASQASGLASVLVAHVRGLRLRVILADEGSELDAAYAARVPAIAAVFGAFPDTSAVLFTTVGVTRAGAIVDRDDVVTAFETPSGQARPPRISRPVMDPAEACAHYVSAVMPAFEPLEHLARPSPSSLDVVDLDRVVGASMQDVVASGARARLEAKRVAWTAMGPAEAAVVADALRSALSEEFDEAAFRARVEELVEVA
jgi:hypothetical protein